MSELRVITPELWAEMRAAVDSMCAPIPAGFVYQTDPDFEPESALYLVELVDLCVKVGISRSPRDRIASHRYAAERHGRTVGRVWVSTPHTEARRNEIEIKGLSPTEYLSERFDDVLARVQQLPSYRAGRMRGFYV